MNEAKEYEVPAFTNLLTVVRNNSQSLIMSILKTLVSTLLLLFATSVFSQEKLIGNDSCMAFLRGIRREWRNDSLGANGFRLSQEQRLSICEVNKLYPDVLFNTIGPSNEVWTTARETEYIYYLSIETLLNGQKRIKYINFVVNSPKNYVVEIERGQIVR